jgi:ABC-2 type transport system permease protein
MRLLAQEWKKLAGSGQTLALVLTVVAVGILLTVFDGVSILGEPANALDQSLVSNLYTGTMYLAWIFPPILGVLSVTSEFRLGTAIATFLLTPHRPRVLVAKMVIGGVGGGIVGALSMVSAFVTAWIIVGTAPESVAPDASQLVGSVLGMVTTGFALGAFGVALGALIRAQLASLFVLLGWMLFVEGILVGIIGPAAVILPGQLVQFSVTSPGDISYLTGAFAGGMTSLLAFLGILVWSVVLAVIASVTTLRKDID